MFYSWSREPLEEPMSEPLLLVEQDRHVVTVAKHWQEARSTWSLEVMARMATPGRRSTATTTRAAPSSLEPVARSAQAPTIKRVR